MMPRLLVILGLLTPACAQAQQPAAVHLGFVVYAAGLSVVRLQSEVEITPERYRIDLAYRTTGLFGAFFSSEISSFVQGRWAGARPQPVMFASWGTLRGANRRTVIDYVAGQPKIRTLEPADESDRDPVPPAMQHDTVDSLSAMAMLVRQVNSTGRCDGHTTMFDGRRLSEITSHTVGIENLEPESRSSFSGPALRCEMVGRQLGGFQHDVSEAELHKLHYSTAWLAAVVPGGQKLPVRVTFETRFFGHATAYLTEAAGRGPIE